MLAALPRHIRLISYFIPYIAFSKQPAFCSLDNTNSAMLRIYKSSAGSGKTYTLVKEYLRIAFSSDAHKYRHILALTFTNKAANEMKERIISMLNVITFRPESSEMARELSELLNISMEDLKEKASSLLRDILHNYSDLSVCTIDSFVHRLIRSFAFELKLSSDFDIETDSQLLLSQAVEKLLNSAGTEGSDNITKALLDFAENNLDEGKGWNLEYALINFSRELFNEDAYRYVEILSNYEINDFIKARDHLSTIKKGFEASLKDKAQKAKDIIEQNKLEEADFFQTRSGIHKYFFALATEPGNAKSEPNSYVNKTISEDKWASGKISETAREVLMSVKYELTALFDQIQEIRQEGESAYILSKLLLRNIYSLMLLSEINRMLNAYKAENNVLHISEFQKRISQIVNEQDAPVIYERLGDWYDCILIDEFQDTSVMQWRNLLPLVENSQMKVEESLIVGDGKQAIYRFRGGDVEQFAALPFIFGSAEDQMLLSRQVAILNYGTETLSLTKNFRSRNEIIDFNNAFYESIAAQPEFAHPHIYEAHAQLPGKDLKGGYVSIDFIKGDADIPYLHTLCAHTEALIYHQRERGYSWSDIAVLTRTNDCGSEIAAYLMQQGIPVVSSESLLIGKAPEVRAIISILYYLSDRDNLIRRAEFLGCCAPSKFGEGGAEIHECLRGDQKAFEQYISSLSGCYFSSYELIQKRLYDLVQALIRMFSFLHVETPFLQFFLDEVLDYSIRFGNRTEEFLEWWEVNKAKKSILYPETMDAVRVMTIHKAKGLQYPVVILPDTDYKLKNTKRFLWSVLDKGTAGDIQVFPIPVQADLEQTPFANLYRKEMDESLLDLVNLLYVATTRAEDRLYIISQWPESEPEKLNSATALLVRYLKAMQLWNGFTQYELGDESTSKPEQKKKEPIDELSLGLVDNRSSKKIGLRRSSALAQAMREGEAGKVAVFVRSILSEIKCASDLEALMKRYAKSNLIDKDQLKQGIKQSRAIISQREIAPYFLNESDTYKQIRIVGRQKDYYTIDHLTYNSKTGTAALLNFRLEEEKPASIKEMTECLDSLRNKQFTSATGYVVCTDSAEITILES